MRKLSPVSPHQFALLRVLLGGYVLAYCLQVLPYGAELFSSAGMLPSAGLNGRELQLFNALAHWDSPVVITVWLAAMAAAAAAFSLGLARRTLAVALWYGWACLANRNIFTLNPSLPFLGWMLLAFAVAPPGEPLRLRGRADPHWEFPPLLWQGAWAMMALGYTVSGTAKLHSPSWINGSILSHLSVTPLWHAWWLPRWVAAWPPAALKAAAWSTLALEVGYAPLALWARARPALWAAMVCWHLNLIALIDLAYISIGMLMIHAFTWDARWMPPRPGEPPPVVFFDGVCGLCNRFVDFLLIEDAGEVLRLAPLQGATAAARLPADDRQALATLVLADETGLHYRSDAVIRTLDRIGGLWRPAAWLLRLVPRPLRDAGYAVVATNRYRWFGRREACRLPTPEERARLLP